MRPYALAGGVYRIVVRSLRRHVIATFGLTLALMACSPAALHPPETNYQQRDPDKEACLYGSGDAAIAACERMLAKGVLVKDTHETTVRFSPPLVITDDELDWGLERIAKVLG